MVLFATSIYEGFKNTARFVIRERVSFYLFGSFISLLITILLYVTTSERSIGLIISVFTFLSLVLGNIAYYVRGERNNNLLHIKFRLMKYLSVGFFVLIIMAFFNQF
jgi:hypothetical protein